MGEIIEASTNGFVAESYVLHDAPAFGSLIRTSDGGLATIAITAGVRTGSIDSGRRPVARGHEELSEEDLYQHNPELDQLLRTEFTAVVVGFREDGAVHQYLPPRPPRIHGFVYQCSPSEVFEFSQQLDFLATLLAAGQRGSADELAAACLRLMGQAHRGADGAERAYLVRAGKELATLLASEVGRLNGILRRIRA